MNECMGDDDDYDDYDDDDNDDDDDDDDKIIYIYLRGVSHLA